MRHDNPATFSYASPWKRLAAILIDGVLLTLAVFILAIVIGSFVSPQVAATDEFESRLNGIGLFLGWMYHAFMESSAKQATIGKSLMGLIVTDQYGDRITFARATGRFFGRLVSVIIFFIGFVMAFFTEKRQALHDIMAGCFVLEAKTNIADLVVDQSNNSNTKIKVDAYKIVAQELSINRKDEALWLAAAAESDGDPEKTKARYAKYRAEQIEDTRRKLTQAAHQKPAKIQTSSIKLGTIIKATAGLAFLYISITAYMKYEAELYRDQAVAKSREYIEKNNYSDLIVLANEWTQKQPDDPFAWKALYLAQRHGAKEYHIKRLLEHSGGLLDGTIQPNLSEYDFQDAIRELGDYDPTTLNQYLASRGSILKSVNLDKSNYKSWEYLCSDYLLNKEYATATDACKKLIELDSASCTSWKMYASAIGGNDYKRKNDILEEALNTCTIGRASVYENLFLNGGVLLSYLAASGLPRESPAVIALLRKIDEYQLAMQKHESEQVPQVKYDPF